MISKPLLLLATLLIGLATTVTGCKSMLGDLVKSPEVSLDQVKVDNVGLKSADLTFELKVYNPNKFNLKIDTVDYKLVLNDKDFADGKVSKIKELIGLKTVTVPIPITVEFSKVFDSLFSALQKPETAYTISGNAKLGPISVPFNKVGKLKWSDTKK